MMENLEECVTCKHNGERMDHLLLHCSYIIFKGDLVSTISFSRISWVTLRVVVEMLASLEKVLMVENFVYQRRLTIIWYCI